MIEFHVEINNGREYIVELQTQSFPIAAIACLAMVEYQPSDLGSETIKIWVVKPQGILGPHYYAWNGACVEEIPPPNPWR